MSSRNTSPIPDYDEACHFIIKLGEAAHRYGSSAVRLEAFLTRLTRAFGYGGVFRSTPMEIVFAFQEHDDADQRIHLSAFSQTSLDLAKLAKVGDLVNAITARQISVSDATEQLAEIDRMPPQWGVFAGGLGYAFVGAGLAALFACGWWDVFFATVFSVIVYGMVVLSGYRGVRAAEWLPLTSAFVVATLAAITRVFIPELNVVMVTFAAIAVLLPGYTISLGLIEVVSQHVVSGMANLMSGLVYMVKQIIGAWLGVALVDLLLAVPPGVASSPVNPEWLWLFVPLLIIALCVSFQTSIRDLLWASIACGIAYCGILLGSAIEGSNLGNLVGSIIAVVFANLWAGKTGRPTSIVLVPALILLVSGGVGFRGLESLAAGQIQLGTEQFIQMFLVALTIGAGLLVGNTISRPRVTL